MASAWGNSWGVAWGNSWGASDTVVPTRPRGWDDAGRPQRAKPLIIIIEPDEEPVVAKAPPRRVRKTKPRAVEPEFVAAAWQAITPEPMPAEVERLMPLTAYLPQGGTNAQIIEALRLIMLRHQLVRQMQAEQADEEDIEMLLLSAA